MTTQTLPTTTELTCNICHHPLAPKRGTEKYEMRAYVDITWDANTDTWHHNRCASNK